MALGARGIFQCSVSPIHPSVLFLPVLHHPRPCLPRPPPLVCRICSPPSMAMSVSPVSSPPVAAPSPPRPPPPCLYIPKIPPSSKGTRRRPQESEGIQRRKYFATEPFLIRNALFFLEICAVFV